MEKLRLTKEQGKELEEKDFYIRTWDFEIKTNMIIEIDGIDYCMILDRDSLIHIYYKEQDFVKFYKPCLHGLNDVDATINCGYYKYYKINRILELKVTEEKNLLKLEHKKDEE